MAEAISTSIHEGTKDETGITVNLPSTESLERHCQQEHYWCCYVAITTWLQDRDVGVGQYPNQSSIPTLPPTDISHSSRSGWQSKYGWSETGNKEWWSENKDDIKRGKRYLWLIMNKWPIEFQPYYDNQMEGEIEQLIPQPACSYSSPFAWYDLRASLENTVLSPHG